MVDPFTNFDIMGNFTGGSVPSPAIPANPIADTATINLSSTTQNGQFSSGEFISNSNNQQITGSDAATLSALRAIQAQSDIPTTINGLKSQIQNALKQQNVNLQHIPNSLDPYANYTYHVRLSFTNEATAYNLQNSNEYQNVEKAIIAESGVTAGFNIKDFEIKNLCAPQDRIGIMLHTTWKMTIAEPYGFSLVDRLYTLSKSNELRIKNHLMCPYFIEIWFTGYNEDGTIADLQQPYYKVFRCFITSLEADATDGGTTYRLEGVVDGSLGNSNEFASPVNNVTIDNVETVGQFFDQLAFKMTEQMKNLQYDNNNKRVEYKFDVKKEWRAWRLTRKAIDSSRSAGFDQSGTPTKPSITIPRGMDISQILQTVLSMTDEGNQFTLGPSVSSGSVGNPSNSKQSGQSQGKAGNNRSNTKNGTQGTNLIPVIHTETKLLNYNINIGDYVREITYHFLDYTTVRGFVDKQAIVNAQQPDVQRTRLKSFAEEGRLNKIYNFIFTGENVDVLKFDLKLENFWFAAQPAHDGENTIGNFSLAPQVQGQSVAVDLNSQYRKAKSDVLAARSDLNGLKDTEARLSGTISDELRAQINLANQTLKSAEDTLDKFIKTFDQTAFEIPLGSESLGQQAITGVMANIENGLSARTSVERAVKSTISSTKNQLRKDRYLEDVKPLSPLDTPLPIVSFTTAVPLTQNNSVGGESKADPSSNQGSTTAPRTRGLLASVIHNVTSGPFFVEIDLEIRGDPYWIGLDNISNNKIIQSAVNGSLPTVTQQKRDAFFGNGETAFLLFFRTGEQPNEDSGFVEFNTTSWAFNGMYVVIEVTNLFKDGKFTQVLKGLKDVAMYSIFNQSPASPSSLSSPSINSIDSLVSTASSASNTVTSTISNGQNILNGLANTAGF